MACSRLTTVIPARGPLRLHEVDERRHEIYVDEIKLALGAQGRRAVLIVDR